MAPFAPLDTRPHEADRTGGGEVLDQRGAAPLEAERREEECDQRTDRSNAPGDSSDQPVEQDRGEEEADERGAAERGVSADAEVHGHRGDCLEQRELVRDLRARSEDGNAWVQQIDAVP